VHIDGQLRSQIQQGLLVLLGIEEQDDDEDIEWLCGKIFRMRIFGDSQGLMNLSLEEINGELLLISQFTLHASTKKGNRPSFIRAARPEQAIPLYEKMIKALELNLQKKIGTGIFGADMQVELVNDGPVTIIIDSKNKE
jgi:D-tyrosyl-tRNA(Tyr) deacylase